MLSIEWRRSCHVSHLQSPACTGWLIRHETFSGSHHSIHCNQLYTANAASVGINKGTNHLSFRHTCSTDTATEVGIALLARSKSSAAPKHHQSNSLFCQRQGPLRRPGDDAQRRLKATGRRFWQMCSFTLSTTSGEASPRSSLLCGSPLSLLLTFVPNPLIYSQRAKSLWKSVWT